VLVHDHGDLRVHRQARRTTSATRFVGETGGNVEPLVDCPGHLFRARRGLGSCSGGISVLRRVKHLHTQAENAGPRLASYPTVVFKASEMSLIAACSESLTS
jgi:hypothetical protein